MKQLMEKQKQMEEELARKQDAEHRPQSEHEVAISVGGGSMQVQASAVAAAAAQGKGAAVQAAQAHAQQQMQAQIDGIQAEMVQLKDHVTELRVHTGLQLSLPDALAKIRDFLGVTQADTRRPNDVLAKAKEFDIVFDESANLRDKVQLICSELGIETGWGGAGGSPGPGVR
jgi:hypothetical protein